MIDLTHLAAAVVGGLLALVLAILGNLTADWAWAAIKAGVRWAWRKIDQLFVGQTEEQVLAIVRQELDRRGLLPPGSTGGADV